MYEWDGIQGKVVVVTPSTIGIGKSNLDETREPDQASHYRNLCSVWYKSINSQEGVTL